jgi:hypothetical protein
MLDFSCETKLMSYKESPPVLHPLVYHAKWGQSCSLDIIKWHARVHKIVPGASSQPRPGSCLQTQMLGKTVRMGK